jgi:hypothetical protein
MKTRNGFVSNSSSSSFAVFGIAVKKIPAWLNEGDGPYEAADKRGLFFCEEAYDMMPGNKTAKYIIGRSPGEMEWDQTLVAFKSCVADDINSLLQLSYGNYYTADDVEFYCGFFGC